MEKERYLIGDVANLIGMSRDTLRYYEKRGLISSEKGNNGYRYYTQQEIAKLTSIMYQRKMNISLEAMGTLMAGGNDSIRDLHELTQIRLKEEEESLQKHRQTIARLKLTQADCQNFTKYQGKISVRKFPSAYVIVPEATFAEATSIWFDLGRTYSGMDMTYLFDEYRLSDRTDSNFIVHQNTQLILYRHLREYVHYPALTDQCETTESRKCLYSCCTSKTRLLERDTVQGMVAYAKKKSLCHTGQVYSTYTLQGVYQGQRAYYQEVYLPLCE